MVDHSVSARDESNGSESSEALMASPENSCFVIDLFRFFFFFAVPTSCCVSECDEKR